MSEFLDWLARASGVVSILLALLGFVFREKWKQLLQRSLSTDLERLKAELSRENAEHAANLIPQLESVKHDFQQKLEAYKVGLIAQAEAAKAQSDLKKSIALRFAEVEFERLLTLELSLAPIGSDIVALGKIDKAIKTLEQQTDALKQIRALGTAMEQAEMFLTSAEHMELLAFRQTLLSYLNSYIGPQKNSPPEHDPGHLELVRLAASTHNNLKKRIREIGIFSPRVAQ